MKRLCVVFFFGFFVVACGDGPTKPPTEISVSINKPSDGGTFWESVEKIPCEVGVRPPEHYSDVIWRLDGERMSCEDSNLSANPGAGEHEVTATVNRDGVFSADTVKITVMERKPPEVSILAPENGEVFSAGSAVAFTGRAVDPRGDSVPENNFVWHSNLDGEIGRGIEVALSLSEGEHTITLTAKGSSLLEGSASVNITVAHTLTGRVFPLGPTARSSAEAGYEILPAENIYAVVKKNSSTIDSVATQENGVFVLQANAEEVAEVCVVSESGDYYTACTEGGAVNEEELRFVLIPRRYTIPTGNLSGSVVTLDLEKSLERGEGSSAWSSFYWTTWEKNEVRSTPRENRPLVVAINRDSPSHDGQTITAQDSINLWESLRDLEDFVGLGELFTPGTADQLGDRTGVEIISDSTRSPYAMSFNDTDNNVTGGRISVSRVYVLESTETISTTMHEAMHVLGAGHTCFWDSMMREVANFCPPESEYPRPNRVHAPSKKDIAHLQILYLSREAQADLNAPFGIMATEAARRAIDSSWQIMPSAISGAVHHYEIVHPDHH